MIARPLKITTRFVIIWLCSSEAKFFLFRQRSISAEPVKSGGAERKKENLLNIKNLLNPNLPYCTCTTHPIKANPAKAGDAKPWVYRHSSDQDCQAAEDHKKYFVIIWLCMSEAKFFNLSDTRSFQNFVSPVHSHGKSAT